MALFQRDFGKQLILAAASGDDFKMVELLGARSTNWISDKDIALAMQVNLMKGHNFGARHVEGLDKDARTACLVQEMYHGSKIYPLTGVDRIDNLVLSHDADVNGLCEYPGQRDLDTILKDRKEGRQINPPSTPLIVAIRQGWIEGIDKLIELKVDVNRSTRSGGTPLMAAIAFNEPEKALVIVQKLLDAGADVTIKNPEGKTVIDLSDTRRLEQVRNLLCKHQKKIELAKEQEIPEEVLEESDADEAEEEDHKTVDEFVYDYDLAVNGFKLASPTSVWREDVLEMGGVKTKLKDVFNFEQRLRRTIGEVDGQKVLETRPFMASEISQIREAYNAFRELNGAEIEWERQVMPRNLGDLPLAEKKKEHLEGITVRERAPKQS